VEPAAEPGSPPGPSPRPADEGRHPGSAVEQWTFLAGPAGLGRLLVVHLTLVPSERRASFAAAVRLDPTAAVLLVAGDLPLPRAGLELRGPGIWADHNVEEPLERWSLGLEAFGVGIDVGADDDLEVLLATRGSPDQRGERAPLGWDLEWISVDAATPDGGGAGGAGGYRARCRVEGELLTAAGALELDLPGERIHHW
jgi:hypothetical protein